VDARAAAIIAYLKKQGVEPENIQTSFVTIHPVYEGNTFGKTDPDFYVAQKNMTVLIKKLKRFDDLTAGLYGVGVNRIDGINFQVSDLEKYKAEAQKRAVQNAKQEAVRLTSELNSKVGRVYSIQESGNMGGPRPYSKAMLQEVAVMDGADGPSIAGGEVVISSRVDVSFIIE